MLATPAAMPAVSVGGTADIAGPAACSMACEDSREQAKKKAGGGSPPASNHFVLL